MLGPGAGTGVGSIASFMSPFQDAVIDESLRQFDDSRQAGLRDIGEKALDVIDVGGIRQSARDYYMGTGGKNLAFMPQKQYVMENFYQPNADGIRS